MNPMASLKGAIALEKWGRIKEAMVLALTIATLLVSAPGFTQPLPAGWSQTRNTPTAQAYVYKGGGAQITVVDSANFPLGDLDLAFSTLVKNLDGTDPACRGLRNATVETINSRLGRIARVRNMGNECVAMVFWSEKRTRIVIGTEDEHVSANTIGLSMQLLQKGMALPTTASSATNGPPGQGKGSPSGIGNAAIEQQLAATIAAIPAARRPVGLIARQTSSMSGNIYTTNTTAWTVFANGYLTDCMNWDPATTDPTPVGLARSLNDRRNDCDIAKWRRAGGEIIVTDITQGGEEVDDARYSLLKIKPFTRGQRVSLNLESTSSFGAQIPGSISGQYGVNNSQLILTPAGNAYFNTSSYRSDYGDSTSGANKNVARYYLDGYIMAVRFPDGSIQKMFVGLSFEAGKTYGYLNGEFYWEEDGDGVIGVSTD